MYLDRLFEFLSRIFMAMIDKYAFDSIYEFGGMNNFDIIFDCKLQECKELVE